MITRTVWKVTIAPMGEQTISLPIGSEILSFQTQKGSMVMWFLCNPQETRMTDRKFLLRGTGHDIESISVRFIGTAQLVNGDIAFHLFEDLELNEVK